MSEKIFGGKTAQKSFPVEALQHMVVAN